MAHRARRRSATLGLVAALAVALPAAATYPTQTVLSGTPTATTSVSAAEISPDGNWVVFAADLRDEGTELWSLPLDGSTTTPTRLTNTPPDGGGVWWQDIIISPDSRWVVTTGDLEDEGVHHVYSVPIDRPGQQLRLSRISGGGTDVNSSPRISADSRRVVYREDLNAAGVNELFSAPIRAADNQITISTTLVSEGDVDTWAITPDGQTVVYRGDLDENGKLELYRAPIDEPSGQTTVSVTPPAGRVTRGPVISPDGRYVVYSGDLTVDERYELYSRPLDGPGPQVRLSETATPNGDVGTAIVTPDSARVVYAGDLTADEVLAVYSAPVDGSGGQIELSDSPVATSDLSIRGIDPASSRVVYTGDFRVDGIAGLFSAPVDVSGGQRQLNTPGGSEQVFEVALSPDGTAVAYRGRRISDLQLELFIAPLDREGEQVRLSGPPPAGAHVDDHLAFAPDGSRVIFTGDYDGDEIRNVYSVPVDRPGEVVRVNEPPIMNGDISTVDDPLITPDSSVVVYLGDLLADTRRELFASGVGQLPTRAPTDVRATQVTETSVRISWERPWGGSQLTGYEVAADPAAGRAPRRPAATVGPNTTATTLTGLTPGTTHTVEVRGLNDAGASAPGTVSFTTTGTAPVEPPPGEPGLERLAGDNRYETAAAIARARFDEDAVETVYLATGANFPDALAGGPLAAADGAPILLTTRDVLPDATAAALAAFEPSRLVLLGGTAAISDEVLYDAAVAAGMSDQLVERVAGDNRYATAAAIAARLPASDTVLLATGTNFPDALTGGAASGGAPILLTLPDRLPAETAASLADLDPTTVTALGGVAAVHDATLTAAGDAAGATTRGRLAGVNRFETATVIADSLPTPDTIYVAVGSNFPDALAGGPPASAENAPILLVTTGGIPEVIADWIGALPDLRRVVILGGEGAISAAVEEQLRSYLAP